MARRRVRIHHQLIFLIIFQYLSCNAFQVSSTSNHQYNTWSSALSLFINFKKGNSKRVNGSTAADIDSLPVNGEKSSNTSNNNSNSNESIPFIIDRLSGQPNPIVYEEIAQMCISAFFNDDDNNETSKRKNNNILTKKKKKNTPFWKEAQLMYLRTLQTNDLERRRKRDSDDSNVMFIARKVIPATTQNIRDTPLIMDITKIYNIEQLNSNNNNNNNNEDYVRGEILGFVEVTLRPYGLGNEKIGFDNESKIKLRKSTFYNKRPILTNLSVQNLARKSGVGTALMITCEEYVKNIWDKYEIILEVEDDNITAQNFYEKRGYEILFEDPASRRYDTTGFWLQQKRCTRLVMRKTLIPSTPAMEEVKSSVTNFGIQVLQKLKENVISVATGL